MRRYRVATEGDTRKEQARKVWNAAWINARQVYRSPPGDPTTQEWAECKRRFKEWWRD